MAIDQQRQKLRNLSIIEKFAVIIISDDIGVSKPDPKIFWHGCKTANEKPADCYYVGDNLYTDVKAASAAGLTGIWLNREQKIVNDAALMEIHTLSKLPEVIQS